MKTTIASYKTTADLIEAMKEVDPDHLQPHVLQMEEAPNVEIELAPGKPSGIDA